MNSSEIERSSTPGNGIYFIIALFFSLIIYVITIILVLIEKRTEFNCKNIMMFFVFINCLQEFFFNSILQYQFLKSPERFDISAIISILIYFIFELLLTYYLVNRLYKTTEN